MIFKASGHWKTAQVFNVKCAYDSKEKWVTAIKCLFLKGKYTKDMHNMIYLLKVNVKCKSVELYFIFH